MTLSFSAEEAKRILPHQAILRKLSPANAAWYISEYLDWVSPDALTFLQSIASTNYNIKPQQLSGDEPTFCAAMFMAGATLGQLSQFYGTTRQSVQARIARRLNAAERSAKLRDHPANIDNEVIVQAHEIYNCTCTIDPQAYSSMAPIEVGRALIAAAVGTISADRGDAPLAHAVGLQQRSAASDSRLNISQTNETDKEAAARIVADHSDMLDSLNNITAAAPPAESTLDPAAPPATDTPAPKPGALGDAALRELDKLFGPSAE